MTPRQLREQSGIGQLTCAALMGMSLRSLRKLEQQPLWAWTVEQVTQHGAACGLVTKISAVDENGVEKDVT